MSVSIAQLHVLVPNHMCPTHLIKYTCLPLTPNANKDVISGYTTITYKLSTYESRDSHVSKCKHMPKHVRVRYYNCGAILL